jgi:hypothetical protein
VCDERYPGRAERSDRPVSRTPSTGTRRGPGSALIRVGSTSWSPFGPCGLDHLVAVRPVRNSAEVLVPSSEPVRRFRWRPVNSTARACGSWRPPGAIGFESSDPASQKKLPRPGPRVAGVTHPDAARCTTTCCTRHRWRADLRMRHGNSRASRMVVPRNNHLRASPIGLSEWALEGSRYARMIRCRRTTSALSRMN